MEKGRGDRIVRKGKGKGLVLMIDEAGAELREKNGGEGGKTCVATGVSISSNFSSLVGLSKHQYRV